MLPGITADTFRGLQERSCADVRPGTSHKQAVARKPAGERRLLPENDPSADMKDIKSAKTSQGDYIRQLSPALLRAARGLLNISAQELATLANVSVATVRRAEAVSGAQIHLHSVIRIREALERQGVLFISSDEQLGEGVRFRQSRAK